MVRLLTLAVAILAVSALIAAPAPLPKRTAPFSLMHLRPPAFSLMTWSAVKYRAEFRSDGTYAATPEGAGSVWRGTWRIERYEDSYRLVVRETSGSDDATATWLEWGVHFFDALTVGGKTPSGTEVRIESWRGRPDT